MDNKNWQSVTIQINQNIIKMYRILGWLRASAGVAGVGILLWGCMRQAKTLQFIAEHKDADAMSYAVADYTFLGSIFIILAILVIVLSAVRFYLVKEHIHRHEQEER
jgi:uncharacterized membrane protein YidH (DUF202 family)